MMSKCLWVLSAMVAAGILSGCISSVNKASSGQPEYVINEVRFEPETELGAPVESDEKTCRFLLWGLVVWGDGPQAYGAEYIPARCEQRHVFIDGFWSAFRYDISVLSRGAALYDACKKGGDADAIVFPKYKTTEYDLLGIFGWSTSSVSGYPVKIKSLKAVPSADPKTIRIER